MRLADKVVIITGAGAGLGRECALLFSEEGARLVVTDVDGARAEATAQAVLERGGQAIALKSDVTNLADHEASVHAAVEEFGRLDVMFSNAGVAPRGFGSIPLEELTPEELKASVDINFMGALWAARASIPTMKAQGAGAILYTISASGHTAFPGFTIYGAAKSGVVGLVRGLAVDLGPFGIRVNGLSPLHGMSANFALAAGADVVGLSYEEAAGGWTRESGTMPLKLATPPSLRDNAYGALYLASDEARWVSGQCLVTTDGGTLARVANVATRAEAAPTP